MLRLTTAFTVIDRVFVSSPPALVAFTVKVEVPVPEGVPLIVFPDRLKPLGKLPLKMLHVIGVVPVADKFWL